MSGSTEERRRREQRGRAAEDKACQWLERAGYRIVARRLRTPAGEIDIVAERRPLLAFVEVKARSSAGKSLLSVSPQQAARIAAAATYFLADNAGYADAVIRFDVIAITPGAVPQHFPDAWRPEE